MSFHLMPQNRVFQQVNSSLNIASVLSSDTSVKIPPSPSHHGIGVEASVSSGSSRCLQMSLMLSGPFLQETSTRWLSLTQTLPHQTGCTDEDTGLPIWDISFQKLHDSLSTSFFFFFFPPLNEITKSQNNCCYGQVNTGCTFQVVCQSLLCFIRYLRETGWLKDFFSQSIRLAGFPVCWSRLVAGCKVCSPLFAYLLPWGVASPFSGQDLLYVLNM